MVLSEPEGLLGIAIADLETAEASSDPPLTHDLRRLLLLLEAEGVATAHHEPLAQLTIYAVQFRYDADPAPLGLDREAFNRQVKELIRHLPAPAAHHRRTHAHEPRGPAADAVAAGFLAAVGAARPRCCLAKGCPAPAQPGGRRSGVCPPQPPPHTDQRLDQSPGSPMRQGSLRVLRGGLLLSKLRTAIACW